MVSEFLIRHLFFRNPKEHHNRPTELAIVSLQIMPQPIANDVRG
jgi:hypothetical protein